ncbi:amino acid ABC transporter ATP-binding protein [Streptomyces sp. NPDC004629]|uniref:amino acid ABC transporter ATP-binding protein n=1 Tax=Streptomyces sp. NPDC004629 TaxID=3364705 RepID=UPI003697BE38
MSTISPGRPFLEAEDIKVVFAGKPAVNGITMQVDSGEVVAIVGPSGSGKSTFLRCINHLQAPTSGAIRVDGVSVVDRPGRHPRARELAALRRKVGMVFQSFNLFPHLTALENITLAQVHALGRGKEESRECALALLDRVGLRNRADHRPTQCSGGQQQRIAIARALALEPKVMLFDEPTSALDPELGADVLGVMRDMAATGMTMIVVTHEMQFAEDVADRVVFISDGLIVEEGEPSKVLRSPQHERTQRFLKAVLDR